MIDAAIVDDVRRRLADGQTQRHIAERLSISRDTVGDIATGRRTEPRRRNTAVCSRCHRSAQVVRGTVCVECAARAAKVDQAVDPPTVDDLALELRPGPAQRYRAVRARRRAIAD
jgi:hypothetical protein